MSNPSYAPYGVDDDPFLTHPAGPGQRRTRPDAPDFWAGDGHYTAPQGQFGGDRTRYDYAAQDQLRAPFRGNYPAYAQDTGNYDDTAYRAAAPHDSHDDWPAQGNFTPRRTDPRYEQPQGDQRQAAFHAHSAGYDDPRYPPQMPPLYQGHGADTQDIPYSAKARMAAPPRPMATPPAASRGPLARGHKPAAGAYPSFADELPQDPYAVSRPQAGQIIQWAGAVCTLLALVGAGYWGYQLAVRDANGIPVVRATMGPLRIAPELPGGEVSAHQGLAVNAIPASGMAEAVPDQITLAPQMGALAPEDTALKVRSAAPAAPPNSTLGTNAEELASATQTLLQDAAGTEPALADLASLTDALPEDMPLSDAEAVERALEAALAEGGDPIADSAPLPLDPAPDQPDAGEDPVGMSNTDPITPLIGELDPATIPLGTPMVQFGAFDTAEIARTEWANLQTRFTELMAGKALVVEQASSGGRDFFRLRAHGFDSPDDTRRFCAAILAENGTCLTVDQR